MVPAEGKSAGRLRFRHRSDCRFVDSEEFCRLIIGTRRMVRADERAIDLHGLLDLETGTRFLIEREKLIPHMADYS